MAINYSFKSSIIYTIVRPANVIGPGMHNHSFNKLIKLIGSNFFFFIGKKDSIANYVHVDDVVQLLIIASENQRSQNQIFNISCDCNWADLINHIANIMNARIIPIRIPLGIIQAPLFILKILVFGRFHIPLFNIFDYRTSYPNTKIKEYFNFIFKNKRIRF